MSDYKTLRSALKDLREMLDGVDYCPYALGPISLPGSWLQVEHSPASDGGILLGCFRFCRTEDPAGYYPITRWRQV